MMIGVNYSVSPLFWKHRIFSFVFNFQTLIFFFSYQSTFFFAIWLYSRPIDGPIAHGENSIPQWMYMTYSNISFYTSERARLFRTS